MLDFEDDGGFYGEFEVFVLFGLGICWFYWFWDICCFFLEFEEFFEGGSYVGFLVEFYEELEVEECGILDGCINGCCVCVFEGFICCCFDGYCLDMICMVCVDINECDEVEVVFLLCVNVCCFNMDGFFCCICCLGFVFMY